MKWRFIEERAYSAAMNMAIDHAICESAANERNFPTIRFYKWIPSSISIGACQNPNEINLEACKKNNVRIVRRMTGGRAVFHDKSDFTYSVIAPIKLFRGGIENAYSSICSRIINALSGLGINALIENKNDILAGGKKISGNAAKLMKSGIYLQHGTLVYDIDFDIMPKVLNISELSAGEKITSILQCGNLGRDEVYAALKNNFTKNKEFEIMDISKSELALASDLAKTKYNTLALPAGVLIRNKGVCYVERT